MLIPRLLQRGVVAMSIAGIIALVSFISLLVTKNRARQVIPSARIYLKKYRKILIILLLITLIPGVLESLFARSLTYIPWATQAVFNDISQRYDQIPVGIWATISNILSILFGLCSAWLGLGLMRANLLVLNNTTPPYSIMTSTPLSRVVQLIIASIAMGLAVLIWFIVFIVPGVWIALRLSLYQYYVAQWYEALDALKASRYATQNNAWNLLGLWMSYIIIIIIWALLLWVGLLRAVPLVSLSQAYVYKFLKEKPRVYDPLLSSSDSESKEIILT